METFSALHKTLRDAVMSWLQMCEFLSASELDAVSTSLCRVYTYYIRVRVVVNMSKSDVTYTLNHPTDGPSTEQLGVTQHQTHRHHAM